MVKSVTIPFSITCAKVWTKQKDKWAEKLPRVLWAYRTIKLVPTGETPFLLAYETIILVDVNMPMISLQFCIIISHFPTDL